MNVIDTVWDALLTAGRPEAGWHGRRLDIQSGVTVVAAIRRPGDVPSLLIEVAASSIPPWIEPQECNGFCFFVEPMRPGPNGSVRLCLVLNQDRYRDVFGVLAQDVYAAVARATDERMAVRNFLERLRGWQLFMQRHGPDGLTVEEQVGLAAELFVLRDVLLGIVESIDAVGSWRGPEGGVHDFALRTGHLEVKGVMDASAELAHIASLEQLEAREELPLVLVVVRLNQSEEGITLPGLIGDVRAVLRAGDPVACSSFDQKLLEAGYIDSQQPRYEATKYRPGPIRFFRVEAGFPRLTRAAVPGGVVSCVYSIRIADCRDSEISPALVSEIIKAHHAN